MATTITAGNATNGLAFSADNAGILELKTGTGSGTTAVTINASQVVNFANAPTGGGMLTSGTAVASTSGTSIDFTGIPSWAKRITVMFNGVSTSGASNFQVQLGSGSFTTSGYSGSASNEAGSTGAAFSAGFVFQLGGGAGQSVIGVMFITLLTANTWIETSSVSDSGASVALRHGNGLVALGGVLDRVRITTANGTDTFDAGTINILWE